MPRLPLRLTGAVWRLVFVLAIGALVLAGPWLMGGSDHPASAGRGIVVEIK